VYALFAPQFHSRGKGLGIGQPAQVATGIVLERHPGVARSSTHPKDDTHRCLILRHGITPTLEELHLSTGFQSERRRCPSVSPSSGRQEKKPGRSPAGTILRPFDFWVVEDRKRESWSALESRSSSAGGKKGAQGGKIEGIAGKDAQPLLDGLSSPLIADSIMSFRANPALHSVGIPDSPQQAPAS